MRKISILAFKPPVPCPAEYKPRGGERIKREEEAPSVKEFLKIACVILPLAGLLLYGLLTLAAKIIMELPL